MSSNVRLNAVDTDPSAAFAHDVREGLGRGGQKGVPCRYLYDEVGSSLFEAITHLPEYGVTRADERLLRRHAVDVARRFVTAPLVVELGSGSGRKTRHVLDALGRIGPVDYRPIDVSSEALRVCAQELSPFATVSPVEADYLEGLRTVVADRRGRRILLLFLGGTIGNFDPGPRTAMLRSIGALLSPGDLFLFGADLVRDPELLLPAYADAIGVTAAFNLNVLARINRELRGDFDLSRFEHLAVFDAKASRVEMHLRAVEDQRVSVADAGFQVDLAAGETIWTESSYKFDADEVTGWSSPAGFRSLDQWIDNEWAFSENLWERTFTPGPRFRR